MTAHITAASPWGWQAVDRLTLVETAEIERSRPVGSTVHFGFANDPRDCTCRIYVGRALVGEAYHELTPILAYRSALASVAREPDRSPYLVHEPIGRLSHGEEEDEE